LVGSANQALLLEKAGADGVIAEGKESGGHIGDVTTIVLVNAVLKSVTNIPVIAAGGIVDKDSYRAMRAMGAAGVQMGTRFVEKLTNGPLWKWADGSNTLCAYGGTS